MEIYNSRNDYVEFRIYNANDTWRWGSLITQRLAPNSHYTWDQKGRDSIQIWFNAGGRWLGPAICKATAVTIDQVGNILNSAPRTATVRDMVHHVVVLMLENRSFDNILGWLYTDAGNKPPRNIPASQNPTYDGLSVNKFWNTRPPSDHEDPKASRVFASRGVTKSPWYAQPATNPMEEYPSFLEQIFGTQQPAKDAKSNMTGFLENYAKEEPKDAKFIMECFSPDQLPVISQLARQYAVCDRWFSPLPCETWPCRSFLHAGTSFGRLNNGDKLFEKHDPIPNLRAYAGLKTIFDVFDAHHLSWKIYQDSAMAPSLTATQFWPAYLLLPLNPRPTYGFGHFLHDAASGTLPTYSLIEPEFMLRANDQHPGWRSGAGCDMRRGEDLIFRVVSALSQGPKWNNTLLIITYDEHGGCYDHVPPPGTAIPPDGSAPQFKAPKDQVGEVDPFRQFGPRVPTVVVSPLIEPGTVFRAATGSAEYDHTSILATLRDWLFRPDNGYPSVPQDWLPSKRVAAAPNLWNVVTRTTPRTDKPQIQQPTMGAPALLNEVAGREALVEPEMEAAHQPFDLSTANSLQLAMAVQAETMRLAALKTAGNPNIKIDPELFRDLQTQAEATIRAQLLDNAAGAGR